MDENLQAQLAFEARKKSPLVAYLLWFFLGGLGAHRFYLGKTGAGIAQVLLLFFGWIPFLLGWVALGLWWIIDAFLIPSITEGENMRLIHRLNIGSRRSMGGTPIAARRIDDL